MQVTVPWPPKQLSPNARVHWAIRSRNAKRYRQLCYLAAQRAGARPAQTEPETVQVCITFHPPDRRRRDWDNLLASIKHGLDGLAQALGVDDRIFRPRLEVGEPVKGGAVQLEIPQC